MVAAFPGGMRQTDQVRMTFPVIGCYYDHIYCLSVGKLALIRNLSIGSETHDARPRDNTGRRLASVGLDEHQIQDVRRCRARPADTVGFRPGLGRTGSGGA